MPDAVLRPQDMVAARTKEAMKGAWWVSRLWCWEVCPPLRASGPLPSQVASYWGHREAGKLDSDVGEAEVTPRAHLSLGKYV